MNNVTVKTTKRKAIPYIINAKCECGGNFITVKPIVYNYETSTILHSCDRCNKSINFKETYPHSVNISDSIEEEFGTAEGLENVVNVIGL